MIKSLVVEDDFISRKVVSSALTSLGECDVASNGVEAVEVFECALREKEPYKLICLDIRLPELDGQEVLKKIRAIEEEHGIYGLDGAKIIMTTGLEDKDNVLEAFRSGCEGYLKKPIGREALFKLLKQLELCS